MLGQLRSVTVDVVYEIVGIVQWIRSRSPVRKDLGGLFAGKTNELQHCNAVERLWQV